MPAAGGVQDKVPYEVLHSVKPHTQFLRPFGAKCYGFIPVAERQNKSLGARAIEGQYLGPSMDQKGFMLFIPKLKTVRVSRTCVFAKENGEIINFLDFQESEVGSAEDSLTKTQTSLLPVEEALYILQNDVAPLVPEEPVENEILQGDSTDFQISNVPKGLEFGGAGPAWLPPLGNRQSRRHTARVAEKLDRKCYRAALDAYAILDAPLTINEAKLRPDWPRWKEAIKEELEVLKMFVIYYWNQK
jgi:hypothetical protein